MSDITALLEARRNGDSSAMNELITLVYPDLRKRARRYLRKWPQGNQLQTTDLIDEAYLRFAGKSKADPKNRNDFFAICATLMRDVIVEHYRKNARRLRLQQVPLEAVTGASPDRHIDFIALDEALNSLAKLEPRSCKVVELKFFVGLSNEEIAEVLDVSVSTIKDDWRYAKAWLNRELLRQRDHDT